MNTHFNHTGPRDTWGAIFEDLAPHDPRGPDIHAKAIRFFRNERFADFREWLVHACPTWEASPSAVLMYGHALAFEQKPEESKNCVDKAEAIWSEMVDDGYIDHSMLERIRSKLELCRSTLAEGLEHSQIDSMMACLV